MDVDVVIEGLEELSNNIQRHKSAMDEDHFQQAVLMALITLLTLLKERHADGH